MNQRLKNNAKTLGCTGPYFADSRPSGTYIYSAARKFIGCLSCKGNSKQRRQQRRAFLREMNHDQPL